MSSDALAPTEPSTHNPDVTSPSLDNARFLLGRELGRGGMGAVVAATDTALDRPVAIKQATTDRPDDLIRFEREARITARLEHPSIVPIHDIGRDAAGRPYYVMRKLDGVPLASRIRDATRIRARLALVPNILAAVDAAAFAHARHVIHRDIKPWNILVGEFGETVLIDWGLARDLGEDNTPAPPSVPATPRISEPQLTVAGMAYGTPGFMSPEQARGEALDARTDVWALGATLLHVLLGHPPFEKLGETPFYQAAVDRKLVAPIHELPPEVPAELAAIIAKAMDPELAARYPDAGALAADLRAFLAGQLVAAHHYTFGERVARFVRRYRLPLAVAAIALVALIAFGVFAIRRVITERDRATVAQSAAERDARIAAEAREAAQRGEKLAADRAESMMVMRASSLVDTRPTEAIAMLATVSPSSPQWPRVRDLAQAAARRGIAHGAHVHEQAVNGLAVSPDGTTIASTSTDGSVVVYDVATTRARILRAKTYPIARSPRWTSDGRSLVCALGDDTLAVIDGATGTVRTLAHGALIDSIIVRPSADGDHALYIDGPTNSLFDVAVAGGTATTIATDVTSAVPLGARLLVSGPHGLHLLDGVIRHELNAVAIEPLGAAMNPRGDRAAFTTFDAVIEIDLATGVERRRWPTSDAGATFYDRDGVLYATSLRDSGVVMQCLIDSKTGRPQIRTVPVGGAGAIHFTTVPEGTVSLASNGGLQLWVTGDPFELAEQPVGYMLASRPDRSLLAIGTLDGGVSWIDTHSIGPAHTVELRPGEMLCAVTPKGVIASSDELEMHPWSGAPYQMLDNAGMLPVCSNFGRYLMMTGMDGMVTLVDIERGGILRSTDDAVVASTALGPAVARGGQVQLMAAGEPPVSVATLPRQPAELASNGPWLVTRDEQAAAFRIDLRSHARDEVPLPIDAAFVVDVKGTVWFLRDHELIAWRGPSSGLTSIGTLPSAMHDLSPTIDGVVVHCVDESVWMTRDGHLTQVLPPGGAPRLYSMYTTIAADRDQLSWVSLASGVSDHLDNGLHQPLVISSDEHWLAASRAADVRTVFVFHRDLVDVDLQKWFAQATNLVFDPEHDSFSWRTP